MSDEPLVTGIFKEELKNRFLCLVEIDGVDTLCYIPSSCRLSNFVDLTGKDVLLKPIAATNSRTKYSLFAIRTGRKYVLVNMSQSNRIIEDALHGRRFSFLGKRTIIKREYPVEGYKCDLFIEDTKTVVEIKSILSFEEAAWFPSVFSQRAIDQLKSIVKLLDMGYRVIYIFVSMNYGVKRVFINKDVAEYYSLISTCIDHGMIMKGYTVSMKKNDPKIYGGLNIVVTENQII